MAGLLLALLAPCACRPRPVPPPLRLAHESRLLSLDPTLVAEPVTASVLANVFEGLVAFDREMRLVPALASSWSNLDDRTWVFELRPGVRFHGGRGLRAADVVFTLDRARGDPSSGFKGRLAGIEDVTAADEGSVRVRTRQPDPLLLGRLAGIGILPEGHVPGPESPPDGTGPYRVVAWRADDALELEAFQDHWAGVPSVRRVSFQTVGPERALRALRAGQVDVLRGLPASAMQAAGELAGYRLVSEPGLEQQYLWIDSRSAGGRPNPFADARVRRAISLAIDREALAAALGGQAAPAQQFAPPGVFGFLPQLPHLAFAPLRAQALLAAAGLPRGFTARLVYRAGAENDARAARVVARMLAAVGLRVEPEAADWQVMFAAWEAGALPFFLAGWRFEEGDALGFLRDCLASRDPGRTYSSFNPGYSDARLDALLAENGTLLRPAERLQQYELPVRRVLDEMPLVPLLRTFDTYAVASRVRWTPRLDGRLLAAEMAVRP